VEINEEADMIQIAMLVLLVVLSLGVVAACLYRYSQTKDKKFLTILGLLAIAFIVGLAAASFAVGWWQ
jgi:hypothetical protein